MSCLGEPTRTERLLTSAEIAVVNIEERPTITIEDGLEIVRAVDTDIPSQHQSFALIEHWMSPTPDLREQILSKPVYGPIPAERVRGKAAAQWLGHETMDRMAVDQGLLNFGTWLRENTPRPTPENDFFVHHYWTIASGGVIADVENFDGQEIPSWQGIMDKYGADDPVVQGYFSKLSESVRLDAAQLIEYLTSMMRLGMVFPHEDVLERVTSQLDSFLLDQGYVPDQSEVVVIEMKKPIIPNGEMN